MIGGRRRSSNATCLVKGLNELSDELGTTIACNGMRQSEVSNPMMYEEVGISFGCESRGSGNENSLLGSFVHNNENGVIGIGNRKRRNEIYRDMSKRDRTGIDRVQRSFDLMSMRGKGYLSRMVHKFSQR